MLEVKSHQITTDPWNLGPVRFGRMFSNPSYIALVALSTLSGLALLGYGLSFTSLNSLIFNEPLSQIYMITSVAAAACGFMVILANQGSFRGSSHWKYQQIKIRLNERKSVEKIQPNGEKKTIMVSSEVYEGYIDLSAQDKNGYMPVYQVKNSSDTLWISSVSFLLAPLYAAGTIVYHVVRIPLVAISLFARAFYEGIKEKSASVFAERMYAVVKEPLISLSVILRTPFCMIGFMLGHLYTLIDPLRFTKGDGLNGRKLASTFERFWNQDMCLRKEEKTYLTDMAQSNLLDCFSQRGTASFYLDRCYQTKGVYVQIEKDGKGHLYIKQLISISNKPKSFIKSTILDIDKQYVRNYRKLV